MKYLIVLLVGIVLGLWAGVNIGKGNAIYDNPFKEKSFVEDVIDSAKEGIDDESLLDKGKDMLEETKEKMKESAKEAVDNL